MSLQAQSEVSLVVKAKIGSGAFSNVYSAKEINSGRTVALKVSRASLRIKRTLLEYEAAVLKMLAGHPNIPRVFAYGKDTHFEYLSMQMLCQDLGKTVESSGVLSVEKVLNFTIQLLGALDFLHGRGLVHRDIKPSNIVFTYPNRSQLSIIDFGLAYRPNPVRYQSSTHKKAPGEPVGVVGTLAYASLNAHMGLELSYRDDLESLAYTFIFLMRGHLPWTPYTRHGSILGQIRQVHRQKMTHTGDRLAQKLPPIFAQLVDHARSLPFDKRPRYPMWRSEVKRTQASIRSHSIVLPEVSVPVKAPFIKLPHPTSVGDIILVKVLPDVSIEGYSAQANHERSFIHDPDLLSPLWSTLARPAVVVKVDWDQVAGLNFVVVVALGCCQNASRPSDLKQIPFPEPTLTRSNVSNSQFSVRPEWPLEQTYCYVFKNSARFYCLPSQGTISPVWKISAPYANRIHSRLYQKQPFDVTKELLSDNPDVRHFVNLRSGSVKIYAKLSLLSKEHLPPSKNIDWSSNRAWFDDQVKVARRRDLDNGRWWSNTQFPGRSEYKRVLGEGEYSDSYEGSDFEEWKRRQGERDRSLTLMTDDQKTTKNCSRMNPYSIDKIIQVERIRFPADN